MCVNLEVAKHSSWFSYNIRTYNSRTFANPNFVLLWLRKHLFGQGVASVASSFSLYLAPFWLRSELKIDWLSRDFPSLRNLEFQENALIPLLFPVKEKNEMIKVYHFLISLLYRIFQDSVIVFLQKTPRLSLCKVLIAAGTWPLCHC